MSENEQALFDRLESEQPPITCAMRHSRLGKGLAPGPVPSKDCTRAAGYFATVHDCTKLDKAPNNGTRIPVCVEYLEILTKLTYPIHCQGCDYEFGSLNHAIWDLQHVY